MYNFGVLILEVLTGKVPAHHLQPLPDADMQRNEKRSQTAASLPEWVRSVVREEWTAEVFDVELLQYKNIEKKLQHRQRQRHSQENEREF